MLKFIVARTKDDESEILYVAKDKDDAMKKGEEIAMNHLRSYGFISVEQVDLDENNHRTNGRTLLYHAWH